MTGCVRCGTSLDSTTGEAGLPTCGHCAATLAGAPLDQLTLTGNRADGSFSLTVANLSEAFRKKYRLEDVLGSGACGQVFRAVDLNTNRAVAIKFLTGTHSLELDRFLREGRVLASVRDPHLVTVFELEALESVPYLVTELLAGTLRQELARAGKLPLKRALDVAGACLTALQACHERGIIHRDLKPENVMFAADGRAKVVDFGVARDTSSAHLTATGALVGTPKYMAPEAFLGKPVGPAADLYAVSLMIHEMLSGKSPVDGLTLGEVMKWQLDGVAPRLDKLVPGVPARVAEVVARGLEKDPERRPRSAGGMRDELKAAIAIGSGPSRSRPGPPVTRGGSGSGTSATSGSRARLGAFALGGVGLIAVIAFALMPGRRQEPVPSPTPAAPEIPARLRARGALAAALAAGQAQVDRGTRWFAEAGALLDDGMKLRGKSIYEPDPAAMRAASAQLEAAARGLAEAAEQPEVDELRALAHARAQIMIMWSVVALDAARNKQDFRPAMQIVTGGAGQNILSFGEAEYPADGADVLRRYFVQLSAALGADSGTREDDLEMLRDAWNVGRCFARIRWKRDAAKAYTGAIQRFDASAGSGPLARACAACFRLGMDGRTASLPARRAEALAALAQLGDRAQALAREIERDYQIRR